MSKAPVAVYGCGGAGVNIARKIDVGDDVRFGGDYIVYYIDTSESNFRGDEIPSENIHFITDKDGAGKIRGGAAEPIKREMPAIVAKFKPAKFNIIISSTSGGSGAVIAQLLADAMISRGDNFVIIYIGSVASQIEIENAVKSLRSLEALAVKHRRPVATHYLSNSGSSRANIDKNAVGAVRCLIGLFNPMHAEMDSADLTTWLTHGSLGSRLVSLSFANTVDEYQKIEGAMSVATIADVNANTDLVPIPAYQTVGFAPQQWVEAKAIASGAALHFVLGDAVVMKEVTALAEQNAAATEAVLARTRHTGIISKDDLNQADDSGLLL